MKILIVSQYFVSKDTQGRIYVPGGTERYAYGLAKQLQEDGYKVKVLSTTMDKDKIGWDMLDGISVYSFKLPNRFYRFFFDLLSFANTIKAIKKFNPDIVHVISVGYRFAIGAIVASKILMKKTLSSITLIPHKEGRKPLPVFLDFFIFSKIIKWCDVIISLSRETKEVLIKETHHKKIGVIPSFITGNYFRKMEKNPNSILFVGRLEVAHKGTDFLIKALYYVKDRIPSVKLYIVGKGSSLNCLKELVSDYKLGDNVIFCDYVPEKQLMDMYSQSEILAMPSLMEGVPMVLLEAMSAGLPIVAFDIDCIAEVLENGKYGLLVKKGDVEGLADQLIKLLNNDELREHYSKMSLERSKGYRRANVVREIEKVYSEFVVGL
jgi:glycosyltransferase involved in cell wall biosynthesis